MARMSSRKAVVFLLIGIVGAWIAVPADPALAELRRDFVSGPWKGYAMFYADDGRFNGCAAGMPHADEPWLALNYQSDGLTVAVRNAPWGLKDGRSVAASLSVDDLWRADVTANSRRSAGVPSSPILSIDVDDVEGFLQSVAAARALTVRAAGDRASFPLAGSHRMIASLKLCLHRGTALQRKADGYKRKASDFFVPQEDARAFARWADKLSRLAHSATTIVGMGDVARLVIDPLLSGEIPARAATAMFELIFSPARDAMRTADGNFDDLGKFVAASGDPGLSDILRAVTARLFAMARDVLRDLEAAERAASKREWGDLRKLNARLARRSHLSYAGDNVYLLIRNATLTDGQVEFHVNRAAENTNNLNIRIIRTVTNTPRDALTTKMPALIAESRSRLTQARRWIASGRALLKARRADAPRTKAARAENRSSALLEAYVELLHEEEALADRFAAALTEAEATIPDKAPMPKRVLWRLVHGGEKSAAALLQRRFALRMKRGAAAESLQDR